MGRGRLRSLLLPHGRLPVNRELGDGTIPAEQFEGLVACTKISSPTAKEALRLHLVEGKPCRQSWEEAGAYKAQFYLLLGTLKDTSERVRKLAPFYLSEERSNG